MENHNLPAEQAIAEELTWREQEVLMLIAERPTNREIAECLHLAESTVKGYVGKILSKLYVKNRWQAVVRAKEWGLLGSKPEVKPRAAVNLPAEATSFVGRKGELGEVRRFLEGCIRDSAESLLAELESDADPDSFAESLARGRKLDIDEIIHELADPYR